MRVEKARCFDCGQLRHLVELPGALGMTGRSSVCLACAPRYMPTDVDAPLQRIEDDRVGMVMAIAKQRQPECPEGWLLGIAMAQLVLQGQDRASLERIWQAVMDNTFRATEKVES